MEEKRLSHKEAWEAIKSGDIWGHKQGDPPLHYRKEIAEIINVNRFFDMDYFTVVEPAPDPLSKLDEHSATLRITDLSQFPEWHPKHDRLLLAASERRIIELISKLLSDPGLHFMCVDKIATRGDINRAFEAIAERFRKAAK